MRVSSLWNNRRIKLARSWLAGDRGGDVGALELARVVLGPTCEMRAIPRLRSLRRDGAYWVVQTTLSPRPLYYPVGLPWRSLMMVLAEQSSPRDWHYYEVPPVTVEPHDVVLDCGAAEGLFTAIVAPRARHVLAVEPLPAFVEGLRRAFAADPVTVVPAALARQPGELSLVGSDIHARLAPAGSGIPVRVETVDGLARRLDTPVTFLKADLEGAELEMLAGATETIRTHRPKIAITTYHAADHAERITALLRDLVPEYQVRTRGLDGDRRTPAMLHAWC